MKKNQMTNKKEQIDEEPISQEESDKLDADLLGIDMLYRSRCVQAPAGSNVKIREVDPEKK